MARTITLLAAHWTSITVHSRRYSRSLKEKKLQTPRKFIRRFIWPMIISDNAKSTNSPFHARGRVGTGNERRWMSDRKLLRLCHEEVLTMRATHTYSRNSNGEAD